MPYCRQEIRRLAWPDAVQIVARRKILCQHYSRLVGQLRLQRHATAAYRRNPSLTARETVTEGKRELRVVLDRYMHALADLRGAVEMVFPARQAGRASRRTPVRSR